MLARLQECAIELAQLTKDLETFKGTVYENYFRARVIEVRNEIAYLNEKQGKEK